jgi:hypothetical protein
MTVSELTSSLKHCDLDVNPSMLAQFLRLSLPKISSQCVTSTSGHLVMAENTQVEVHTLLHVNMEPSNVKLIC